MDANQVSERDCGGKLPASGDSEIMRGDNRPALSRSPLLARALALTGAAVTTVAMALSGLGAVGVFAATLGLTFSLASGPAQAACTFVSFWGGGCDKEIKQGLSAAGTAAGIAVGKPSDLDCGAANQRPCTILEWVPSCNDNLKEDFDTNKCVPLAPGEWSPFFAGLKSVGGKVGQEANRARKICTDTAADYIQAHGASPFAPRAMLPGPMTGMSPTLEAYVAVGFACSTPHLLSLITAVAEEVSKLGGGGNLEKELSDKYQKYYDTPICQSSKDVAGRVACAVAGVVGGSATEGVMCVIGGVETGAFNGFAAGGGASERAIGLAIGQVLFIAGETYMVFEATKALSAEIRKSAWSATKRSIVNAWEGGAMTFNTAADTIEALGNVGSVITMVSKIVGGVHTAEGVIGKLGNVHACNLPVVNPDGKPYRSIVADGGYIYGVQHNGDLWYWRVDAGGSVGASGKIGNGWSGMKTITAGDTGELFAVDAKGDLFWYKHDSNMRWQVSGAKIGSGWGSMKAVFAGGTAGGSHIVYGIDANGTLKRYSFTSTPNGSLANTYTEDIGWGWSYPAVFAASNGVVYAITANGGLVRYAFSSTGGTPRPELIGNGWSVFKHVFAGSSGAIYGVEPDGKLYYYRDLGTGGVTGPESVGFGFSLLQVTGMLKW